MKTASVAKVVRFEKITKEYYHKILTKIRHATDYKLTECKPRNLLISIFETIKRTLNNVPISQPFTNGEDICGN